MMVAPLMQPLLHVNAQCRLRGVVTLRLVRQAAVGIHASPVFFAIHGSGSRSLRLGGGTRSSTFIALRSSAPLPRPWRRPLRGPSARRVHAAVGRVASMPPPPVFSRGVHAPRICVHFSVFKPLLVLHTLTRCRVYLTATSSLS